MKRLLLATTIVVGAAGLASQADAARFLLTNGERMYTGSLGSNSATSALMAGATGNSPAIAFDSTGRLFGAFATGGSTEIRQISGWEDPNAFAPTVSAVLTGTTDSQTNSFDFRGTGSGERMIGTRNRVAGDGAGPGPMYFESTSSAYSGFTAGVATGFGPAGSYPSSGYDRDTGTYWAITAGTDGSGTSNRRIIQIDTTTGAADSTVGAGNTALNLTFAAGVDYGTIVLAGGDFTEYNDTFYLSFFSEGLGEVVIGSVDVLGTGLFTELSRFNLGFNADGSAILNQGTMGLAIIIPTPLAGGMSVAGLMLVGARRRRVNA
jgi:hypothetical protein